MLARLFSQVQTLCGIVHLHFSISSTEEAKMPSNAVWNPIYFVYDTNDHLLSLEILSRKKTRLVFLSTQSLLRDQNRSKQLPESKVDLI